MQVTTSVDKDQKDYLKVQLRPQEPQLQVKLINMTNSRALGVNRIQVFAIILPQKVEKSQIDGDSPQVINQMQSKITCGSWKMSENWRKIGYKKRSMGVEWDSGSVYRQKHAPATLHDKKALSIKRSERFLNADWVEWFRSWGMLWLSIIHSIDHSFTWKVNLENVSN